MAVRSLTGNKGEWSELYAFFRLLAEGRVHAADEHARRIDAVYYPILKVVREECAGSPVEYVIDRGASCVDVVAGGSRVCSVAQAELAYAADRLLAAIKAGSGSFAIDDIADFADGILVRKIKAPSRDKTDIKMQIEDVFTNTRQNVGFSIKSELGGAPTLLNASRATNFVFAVRGLSPDDAARINAIEGRSKSETAWARSAGRAARSSIGECSAAPSRTTWCSSTAFFPPSSPICSRRTTFATSPR